MRQLLGKSLTLFAITRRTHSHFAANCLCRVIWEDLNNIFGTVCKAKKVRLPNAWSP
jgi:hypothetical protein